MRIYNQKIILRKVLFSYPAAVVYLSVFAFFVYSTLNMFPVWLEMKHKYEKAESDLQNVQNRNEKQKETNENLETDIGKKRYEKEFFNKLDDGEKMIILYGEEVEEKKVEENVRDMTWYEQKKQDFLVWFHNLNIK